MKIKARDPSRFTKDGVKLACGTGGRINALKYDIAKLHTHAQVSKRTRRTHCVKQESLQHGIYGPGIVCNLAKVLLDSLEAH